ncbi:histone methylation protein DOT1-domain-containing protein [Mycena latifolia]|nr:histone methylation protein DOT1-domain-containing protein [Mycena latifolia]
MADQLTFFQNNHGSLKVAENLKDGQSFLQAFTNISSALHNLKTCATGNLLLQAVGSWSSGIPRAVLFCILGECYQRCVGPNLPELKHATESRVYGELTPPILYDIFQATQLTHDCIFLDLGCGAGTAVIQASLQTGCSSYGIEIGDAPAKIARELVAEFKVRCRMWGIQPGNVDVEHGDMLTSSMLKDLICQADVLLINNRRFTSQLNLGLKSILAGLKDGAQVITMEPLGTSVHAKMSEWKVRSVIPFCVTKHFCPEGSFSWANKDGAYYHHRITRSTRSEWADFRRRQMLPPSTIAELLA